MKRILSFVMVVMVLMSLTVSVFAATDDFVPSINEKPAPEIKSIVVTIDGVEWKCGIDIDDHCILVTPVSEITEENRLSDATKQKLVDVFNKIKAAAKLSDVFTNIDGVDKMTVRDLFDVSSICDEFNKVFPGELAKVKITFDLGIDAKTNVVCASLVNDAWKTHEVVNNGDGTVTVEFTHFCPVAFLVSSSQAGNGAPTGDYFDLAMWSALLVASLAAIVVLVVLLRKKATDK